MDAATVGKIESCRIQILERLVRAPSPLQNSSSSLVKMALVREVCVININDLAFPTAPENDTWIILDIP